MEQYIISVLPLLIGWGLDLLLGDPAYIPHPVVGFGKTIHFLEKKLNRGDHRIAKGAVMAVSLIIVTLAVTYWILRIAEFNIVIEIALKSILIFFCLAGTTLAREVRMVFKAVGESIEAGRRQVARIVGRDTSNLSEQEVKTAALETLAENLSDGVIAPLFWYMILGVPGMMAYKMINTLDSMVGYRNQRFLEFGRWSAIIDDIANYLPARITAFLMLLASGSLRRFSEMMKYACAHLSPNSGYPEAALAVILNCRFGGPHDYFGETVDKPFIGDNDREITQNDCRRSIVINRRSEIIMIVIILLVSL